MVRGGRIVNIGGTVGKRASDVKWLMDNSMKLVGSAWFTSSEGCDMVEMILPNVIDLSIL